MSRLILVESTFVISSFFEDVDSFTMFLKLIETALINIPIRVLYDCIANNVMILPYCFHYVATFRVFT